MWHGGKKGCIDLTEEVEKDIRQKLEEEMKKLSIQSVANGYREANKKILSMLKSGKTKKEIQEYIEWTLENYEIALDKSKKM